MSVCARLSAALVQVLSKCFSQRAWRNQGIACAVQDTLSQRSAPVSSMSEPGGCEQDK